MILRAPLARAATALAGTALLFAALATARAQGIDPSKNDHLKCYRIEDSLQPTKFLADLTNQFGVEPGCVIMLPARVLCVETEKQIISSPLPPGGGPSGAAAGHFLCYAVRCPTTAAPGTINVEDQFGRRTITIDRARILCAPADKLICGDGTIDPGEACDPGSAATNVCPDGSPCNADCTCPPGVCCQCTDGTCTTGTGTICPAGCSPMPGATCGANGLCETCPCGDICTDDAGNVGVCTDVPGDGPCECVVPPPCECGVTCILADGSPGRCQEIAGSNVCECRPEEDCPCGETCDTRDGQVGHCRPPNNGTTECECRPDEPPGCECGDRCQLADGNVGVCQPTDGDVCECRPSDCPCDTTCTAPDGQVGLCRHLPGNPSGVCTCFIPPPPPECQCGKPCLDENGQAGRCRPIHGSSGECGCVSG